MLGRTLAVSAALWLLAAPSHAALERVTVDPVAAGQGQHQRHISLPGVLDPAGVVGQIGETLGQAGRVLGLRIADTVADLVSSAFGHGPSKHAAPPYPYPAWTRGDPGQAPAPLTGPYYPYGQPQQQQQAPATAPASVLGGILKLLGLDSSKLGAIALNGVIFLAQLISSSFGGRPTSATSARNGGDAGDAASPDAQGKAERAAEEDDADDDEEEPAGTPLSWILDNPAVKGSAILREARDADISERLIAEIQKRFPGPRAGWGAGARRARRAGVDAAGAPGAAGSDSGADTSCIQLLVCKAGPFLRGMQRSLRPALGAPGLRPRAPAAPGTPGLAGAPKGDPGVPTDRGRLEAGQQSAEEVAEADRWRRLSPVQRMFAHMPSAGEVLDRADTCAERFPDCKVSY